MFYPTHNSIYKLFSYFYSNNTEVLQHELSALRTELEETQDYAHDIAEQNKRLKERLEQRLITIKSGTFRLHGYIETPYKITYDPSDEVFNVINTNNNVSIMCAKDIDLVFGYIKSNNKKKSQKLLPP
jgi:hypothetical protein